MRFFAAVVSATALALTLAGAGGAWTSNFWRSPTGNIACRYWPNIERVTCLTENDRFAVTIGRYERRGRVSGYTWVPSYAPTLPYGVHWTAPGFNCWSRADGMLCRTPVGHGFFISRTTYEVW